MATHVKQKALWGHVCAGQAASLLSLQAGQVCFSITCNSKCSRAGTDRAVCKMPLQDGPLQVVVAHLWHRRKQAGRCPSERSPTDSRSVADT